MWVIYLPISLRVASLVMIWYKWNSEGYGPNLPVNKKNIAKWQTMNHVHNSGGVFNNIGQQ